MPARSKAPQRARRSRPKRGERNVSELKGPANSIYESMSERQLEEFAAAQRKGKAQHAPKK
jgi:hypothetical protein